MRRSFVPVAALLAISAGVSLSGMVPAVAQEAPAPEAAAKDAAPPPLSEEDQTAAPFPPGRNAALVKKVCTVCHSAKPIMDLQYDRQEATDFYKNMVESDTTTEQAQKIIEYLSTVLGH